MEKEKSSLKGLLGKLAVGATLALGVADLSSCNTNVPGFGGQYYGPGGHPEITELTRPGIRQSDGSVVNNYSRDPIVQNKLKKILLEKIPRAVKYRDDGTIYDIQSFVRLPDGRAEISYYRE